MSLLMAPNALDLLGTSRSCECCWGPSRAWPLSPSQYHRQRVVDNRIWRSQRRTWWCRCWCRDAWPSRSATRAHGYAELQRGSPLRGWKYRKSWRISTRMMRQSRKSLPIFLKSRSHLRHCLDLALCRMVSRTTGTCPRCKSRFRTWKNGLVITSWSSLRR